MTSLLTILFLASGPIQAEEKVEMSAQEIAKKNIETIKGFKDSYEKIKMILRTDDGREAERLMTMRSLEVNNDGDKSLIVFENPAAVKGSAVLTHSHIKEDDDQWIYLPALKRVKRISSSNKSGSFMGSEIAYEDLSSIELEKFTYKLDGMAEENGQSYYKLVKKPAYENSGYSKIVDYVRTDNFVVDKSVRYDENGKLYKTLKFSGFKLYPNGVWKQNKINFTNHITNKSTDLVWRDEVKFNNGFSDNDFSKSVMKRLN